LTIAVFCTIIEDSYLRRELIKISKNNARIIRRGLVAGKSNGASYGTREGRYNLLQFWGFNISSHEMGLGVSAYERAYQKAYNAKLNALTDSEVAYLHRENKILQLDPKDQEIFLLKERVRELQATK